jgi:hypothetical protein
LISRLITVDTNFIISSHKVVELFITSGGHH